MAEHNDFQRKQYAFAAHIRDPERVPAPPGIEDRRMAIYRELFFNNLRNLLGNTFPVLRKLHDDAHWNRFIRQFMRRHRSKTPYFLELPAEFLEFLQHEYEPQADEFPFLAELAHYEYVELALSVSTDTDDAVDVDPNGSLLSMAPAKSPLAWVFAYRYPVHRISRDFIPVEPGEQPCYLALFRRADDTVGFLELNPMTAALLEAIEHNSGRRSGEELLLDIAANTNYRDTALFVTHGAAAMQEMRDLGILTGARNPRAGEMQHV